ncbi:hypothetical protein ACGK9U_09495 [Mariniflexile sp. HNIBRBA6329]|uniref:hypothetical protein n=1 Tax=Mariniflexile sp. HNIBRBA6329 TaxID=3373088 RepID=UPI003746238A
MVEGKGEVFLLVVEGESVGDPVLHIGNTNSRYCFSIDTRPFMNELSKQGPSHNCAIGVGHITNKIEKLGNLLKFKEVRIC